ncbi:MAG: DNA internalization-related competence protein ComEC/Rec2 [Bilifractor sp.]
MRYRPICIVCLLLMLGILVCHWTGIPVFGQPALSASQRKQLSFGTDASCTGVIRDRVQKKNSMQYIVKDCIVQFYGPDGQSQQVSMEYVKATVLPDQGNTESSYLPIGSVVRLQGEIREIQGPSNPGEFDSRAYFACQRIYYELMEESCTVLEHGSGIREQLALFRQGTGKLQAGIMHPEQAGVLAAMLQGDRTMLSEESLTHYRYGGVMHVLAISGLHISLLGMMVFHMLTGLLFRCFPRHVQYGQITAVVLAVLAMLVYCLFVGSPVSAIRALVMFGVSLGARALHRSYDSLCALGLSAILILLANPGYLFYSGFLLSYAAVGGAALFYPAFLGMIPGDFWHTGSRMKKLLEKIIEAVLIWCSVMVCTIPLMAVFFFEISVLPFATLLIVPAMGIVLTLGFLGSAAGMLFPALGWVLLIPVDLALQVFDKIAEFAMRIPFSTWTVGKPDFWQVITYYCCLLFFLICMKIRRRGKGILLLASAILVLSLKWSPDFSLTMLAVGQGDCMVVSQGKGIWKSGGDPVFLVDGGSSTLKNMAEYQLIPYLKSRGVTRIRGIFVSHGDLDHINGIEELLRKIRDNSARLRVDVLYMTPQMQTDAAGIRLQKACKAIGTEVIYLKKGDLIKEGMLRVRVLHPEGMQSRFQEKPENSGSRNEDSMVLLVSAGAFDALLTGDLEGSGEEALLQEAGQAECLKVAHHGSRNSTSSALLHKIQPRVCMISAPAKSRYGHPHAETLKRIGEAGAVCYVTKDHGAIYLETSGKGDFRIRTYKRGVPESQEPGNR